MLQESLHRSHLGSKRRQHLSAFFFFFVLPTGGEGLKFKRIPQISSVDSTEHILNGLLNLFAIFMSVVSIMNTCCDIQQQQTNHHLPEQLQSSETCSENQNDVAGIYFPGSSI